MKRRSIKSRVEQRRRQQKREFLLVMAGFTLLLGGWLWYHFIYIRTPEYAMRQITQAFSVRDAAKVERYIDFDRVLDAAYDDLTDDLLYYDAALTDETRKRYATFYDVIKPQMLHGLKDTLHRFAATGEWLLPDGADLTKGRQLGIDFERFLERSQLRNTDVLRTGAFHLQNRQATGQVELRDRHSQTEFSMIISLEQAKDGHWQIIRLENYRQYLDTIAPRQNQDIADYIAATRDVILTGNEELENLQDRFQQLTRSAGGQLSGSAAKPLGELIRSGILPLLKKRQARLDEVPVPLGAQYLANQRHLSTDLAIAAWQHYLKAIETGSYEEFNIAETLKKQEVETDLRIKDIIRHNTVSQALPEIP